MLEMMSLLYYGIWAFPDFWIFAFTLILSAPLQLCSSMWATVKNVLNLPMAAYMVISLKLSQLRSRMWMTVGKARLFVKDTLGWILSKLLQLHSVMLTYPEVRYFFTAFSHWIQFNFVNPGYLYYVFRKLTGLAVFLLSVLLIEPDMLAVFWIRWGLVAIQIFSFWSMRTYYHVDEARSSFCSHACYGMYLAVTYLMFRFHFASLEWSIVSLFYVLFQAVLQWIFAIGISDILKRKGVIQIKEGENAYESNPIVAVIFHIVNELNGSFLFDAFFVLDFISQKKVKQSSS